MNKHLLVLLGIFLDGLFLIAAQRGSCQNFGILPRGRVKIRNKGRVIKFSCDRGYMLIGSEVATCIRREWMFSVGIPPVCVTTGCKPLSSVPNGRVQLEYKGAMAKIKCNPGYLLDKTDANFLFCDGFDWNGTLPVCRAVLDESAPTSCDFETDFCSWTQDTGHKIDWERQQFSTPSGHIGTGPSFDHTYGEGHAGYYAYLEASGARSLNDSARLFSPLYKAELSKDSCFIFWYHMYGASMGTLNILLKPENKQFFESKLLFTQSGNLGNQWIQGIVPLEETNENFQLIIEGLRGSSYMSDMAIDDIQIAKGDDCLPPTTSTTPETSTRPTISHFLSCNGKCGLTPVTPDGSTCYCGPTCLNEGTCCMDYTIYCLSSLHDRTETVKLSNSNIITVVSVIIVVLGSTLAVIVTAVRRKQTAAERQDQLADDSDVRYLHSDEEIQLDLSEQEPVQQNRKSAIFGFDKL
ncbi:MAM and LDL-receptor class A domain-containing protein 1-like isoform X2 [Artemia franciscana]|uniref:MAM and LDL-receptor class A domain-containing protein 1-like isoform X2 n=1 Tax=Artemia franciscana TaxID=6661 RepID=UPI0032DBA881